MCECVERHMRQTLKLVAEHGSVRVVQRCSKCWTWFISSNTSRDSRQDIMYGAIVQMEEGKPCKGNEKLGKKSFTTWEDELAKMKRQAAEGHSAMSRSFIAVSEVPSQEDAQVIPLEAFKEMEIAELLKIYGLSRPVPAPASRAEAKPWWQFWK